jgi:HK97 family phage prohead protease
VELRADDDTGTLGVAGYAATWGVPYDVAGGPPWGWTETVERVAVDRALDEAPDIRLLVNHDSVSAFGLAIARTAADTLTVTSDNLGLYGNAPELDLADPVVQHVRSALRQRNADQMSWAFRVSRQEWNEDYTERRILEVSRIYDVSIVTFPANPATVVGITFDAETEIPKGMSLDYARSLLEVDRLNRAI